VGVGGRKNKAPAGATNGHEDDSAEARRRDAARQKALRDFEQVAAELQHAGVWQALDALKELADLPRPRPKGR
jgi:hypothetical protein